eukprot:scaffold2265_cov62-Phaeocystis_antarctica.AAC.5
MRRVRPVGGIHRLLVVGGLCAGREGWQARLHSLKDRRVPAILSTLAARLRRQQPIEFAVETVAVRAQGG